MSNTLEILLLMLIIFNSTTESKNKFKSTVDKHPNLHQNCYNGQCKYSYVYGQEDLLNPKCSSIKLLAVRNITEPNIKVGAFRRCTKVLILDLCNNGIEKISTGGFLGLEKLEELYLSNNKIQHIEPASFYALAKLEVFVMANNKFKLIPMYEFRSAKIRYLDLSGNELIELPPVPMSKFSNLDFLDISYNSFISLEAKSFYNLKPGGKIVFNHNNLITIPLKFNITKKVMKYSKLQLLSNNFEVLTPKSLGEFYKLNLIKVDFSNNKIRTIEPYTFANYTTLKTILLCFNQVKNLYADSFFGLNSLENLDLSFNNVIHTIFQIYIPLTLRKIDLRFNDIEYIPDYKWIQYSKRRILLLNLQHNKITDIDALRYCSHINNVSINFNNWNCTDLYMVMRTFDRRRINVINNGAMDLYSLYGIKCNMDKQYIIPKHKIPKIDIVNSDYDEVDDDLNFELTSYINESNTTPYNYNPDRNASVANYNPVTPKVVTSTNSMLDTVSNTSFQHLLTTTTPVNFICNTTVFDYSKEESYDNTTLMEYNINTTPTNIITAKFAGVNNVTVPSTSANICCVSSCLLFNNILMIFCVFMS